MVSLLLLQYILRATVLASIGKWYDCLQSNLKPSSTIAPFQVTWSSCCLKGDARFVYIFLSIEQAILSAETNLAPHANVARPNGTPILAGKAEQVHLRTMAA